MTRIKPARFLQVNQPSMAKLEENLVVEEQTVFFDNKLKLVQAKCHELEGDVLVVPCYPDIMSGDLVFSTVVDLAGSELPNALRPYLCYDAGSCKLTPTFEFKNYKKLAMCILPELFEDTGLTKLDRVKVSMCISDALDLSAESGAKNVVFTPWPIALPDQAAEITQLCIAHWIRTSMYAPKIEEIVVAIEDDQTFQAFLNVTRVIDADPTLVLDVLHVSQDDDQHRGHIEYDERVSQQNEDDKSRAHQEGRSGTSSGTSPFLFYSRNLSTSILSIEQPDGTIRQYRLSTTVAEKNTHYFRCSRCDYLSRNNSDMGSFRPKITFRDGRISSARFPEHHPLCHGTSKEAFVVQQLDRLWKAIAVHETPELRNCYVTLRNLAPKEADALYSEMENPQGRFPDWECLRQMAESLAVVTVFAG